MHEVNNMLDLATWLVWRVKDMPAEDVCEVKAAFNKDPGGMMAAADVSQDAMDCINRVFDWILKQKNEGIPIV